MPPAALYLAVCAPPILVGDFNCILHSITTKDVNFRSAHKCSLVVEALVGKFLYMDSYRVAWLTVLEAEYRCPQGSCFLAGLFGCAEAGSGGKAL
jgi:hypothetical protein